MWDFFFFFFFFFFELNDFIAVFNRLNSIGREGLVLNVRDLGTVN